jgi:NADH-quinone oxidoreductase subunit L
LGGLLIKWILYSKPGLLGSGIYVLPQYDVLQQMSTEFHGAIRMIWHSFATLPFWLSVAGIVVAWLTVVIVPKFLEILKKRLYWLYWILVGQYGFDKLNEILFARGGMKLADFFFKFGDLKVIDDFMVNGSGRSIGFFSRIMRRLQSGYLYHYVFVMIIGVLAFLCWMYFAR